MKLHLAQASGSNLFTGYGPGYVAVNNVRHERHLVVMSDRLLEWEVVDFESFSATVFKRLLVLGPELVIVGTGATLRFPAPAVLEPLAAATIGTEIMDSRAACRTYNTLTAEGRKVLAAILVE